MPSSKKRPRVILRHCPRYDVELISRLAQEALQQLNLTPTGRTLIKPNVVASGALFEHAHTRAEFVEGVALALKALDQGGMQELAIGERCGITIPTRYAFKHANYEPVFQRTGARRYHFEETQQVEVPLTHARRLRDYIYVPEPVALADFFVNCPKFKAHPWTTVTFSMKNYIGIQDDRHRLIDHDYALGRKVADLQHVIQPQFVAIDCIVAGEGRMLTPIPRKMELAIFGDNQVAVDSVCCHIIGVDPREVEHIRFAHEDGFGPIDLAQIDIEGDVPLGEAQERASGFEVGLVRVEKYFAGTKISAYAGPAPNGEYCWGGCPGALEEAIEVLRLYDAECDRSLPRLHLVFGDYRGALDVSYGEKVVFIGDCARFDGQIGGQLVQISSRYQERGTKDPHLARHDDIYKKMLHVGRRIRKAQREPFLELDGCPVSVAELVLMLSQLGNIKNPYLDQREVIRFNRAYLAQHAALLWDRLRGSPYQVRGQSPRGAASSALPR